jgi:hypothetical protein
MERHFNMGRVVTQIRGRKFDLDGEGEKKNKSRSITPLTPIHANLIEKGMAVLQTLTTKEINMRKAKSPICAEEDDFVTIADKDFDLNKEYQRLMYLPEKN